MHSTVIQWFRRDLRLTDNTAFHAAIQSGSSVIPAYILSTWTAPHRWTGPNRQSFLCGSLRSLAANLDSAGSRLILREGDPVHALAQLAQESGATAIHCHGESDPHGKMVERQLQKFADTNGIELCLHKDLCMREGREVLTATGEPFRVFTPYSKAWRKLPLIPPAKLPEKLPQVPSSLHSLPLPELTRWETVAPGNGVLEAGERAARTRMNAFLSAPVSEYGKSRDIPSSNSTSRLSQDLRFGLLSIRELFARAEEVATSSSPAGRSSVEKYISELIWREFYMQILARFPEVLEVEFNPKFRGMPWPGKKTDLLRWQNGETGFPIVDAGMRELRETGFMHNRVRMISAMFLTKDLHVDWREGESWFMRHLTDGEIASNNGGWQWSAGTGADAAPYFRIQNPWLQTKRYDPRGEYIRKWIPELHDVPPESFTQAPEDGKPLARNYPLPMVDHSSERDRTMDIFQAWGSRQSS